jgi:hypothetical protein
MHIRDRLVDNGWFADAAPPREQTDAPGRRLKRLAREPSPDRQHPVQSQRWTGEDALLRAAVFEFGGWNNPWRHIAGAAGCSRGLASICGANGASIRCGHEFIAQFVELCPSRSSSKEGLARKSSGCACVIGVSAVAEMAQGQRRWSVSLVSAGGTE